MQKLTLTFFIALFGTAFVFSQSYPKARYLNVDSDKNTRLHFDKDFCLSCSDENYIIDGNESEGYIELGFSDVNTFGTITKAELIMNCSDVQWAETGEGFSVYVNDKKIGSITKIERNKMFTLNLDPSELNKHKKVTLVLKANGEDGIYVLSKQSGFGAVLKLQY